MAHCLEWAHYSLLHQINYVFNRSLSLSFSLHARIHGGRSFFSSIVMKLGKLSWVDWFHHWCHRWPSKGLIIRWWVWSIQASWVTIYMEEVAGHASPSWVVRSHRCYVLIVVIVEGSCGFFFFFGFVWFVVGLICVSFVLVWFVDVVF